ncbi:hypothetical protein AAC387_Pa06g1294 [Persea americana]
MCRRALALSNAFVFSFIKSRSLSSAHTPPLNLAAPDLDRPPLSKSFKTHVDSSQILRPHLSITAKIRSFSLFFQIKGRT